MMTMRSRPIPIRIQAQFLMPAVDELKNELSAGGV